MILHAALLLARGGRDVEHVFDPVGAIGNLNFPPIVVGVLEPAVPVHAEAEEVHVEVVLGGAVLHDKTGVNHARADLLGGGGEETLGWELHEGDRMVLRIEKFEMLYAVRIFRDGPSVDVVIQK